MALWRAALLLAVARGWVPPSAPGAARTWCNDQAHAPSSGHVSCGIDLIGGGAYAAKTNTVNSSNGTHTMCTNWLIGCEW